MRSAKAMDRLLIPILSGLVLVPLILSGWAAPRLAAQAKGPAKAPSKTAPSKAAAPAPQAQREIPVVRRRDPFEPLIARDGGRGQELPQCAGVGKAGLVVATVRLDGVVQSANGMIAVVANAQNRVYFLREGDRLCNGAVERISMEGVTFRERGKDPFGNPLDRVVAKRLYPSAGEQR
jgi:hypothetical protein